MKWVQNGNGNGSETYGICELAAPRASGRALQVAAAVEVDRQVVDRRRTAAVAWEEVQRFVDCLVRID
jgi:hypothetical protein